MKRIWTLDGDDAGLIKNIFWRLAKTVNEETLKKSDHIKGSLCIVGSSGNLLGLAQTTNASATSVIICQEKAFTAAYLRKTTYAFGKDVETDPNYLHNMTPPDKKLNTFQGGVPLLLATQPELAVGAVGFSGMPSQRDEEIVQAILKRFAYVNGLQKKLKIPLSANLQAS